MSSRQYRGSPRPHGQAASLLGRRAGFLLLAAPHPATVHFAAAVTVDDEYLVAAAGDRRLLDAWRADGISVVDTNAPTPAETPQETSTETAQASPDTP